MIGEATRQRFDARLAAGRGEMQRLAVNASTVPSPGLDGARLGHQRAMTRMTDQNDASVAPARMSSVHERCSPKWLILLCHQHSRAQTLACRSEWRHSGR